MNSVALVCIILGSLIVVSRGLIVVAPATTLRWFTAMIETEARVRTLGFCVLLLPVLMIWAGSTEDTALALVLLIFGLFFLFVAIPLLLFFPRSFMDIASAFLPTSLMTWRLLGLMGVLFGLVLIYFGWGAL